MSHARAQVDAAKKRAAAAKAAERRAKASRGWVGWLWGSGDSAAAAWGTAGGEADEDAEMRGDLTPQDEEALKELSNEQEAALSLGVFLHTFVWLSDNRMKETEGQLADNPYVPTRPEHRSFLVPDRPHNYVSGQLLWVKQVQCTLKAC